MATYTSRICHQMMESYYDNSYYNTVYAADSQSMEGNSNWIIYTYFIWLGKCWNILVLEENQMLLNFELWVDWTYFTT